MSDEKEKKHSPAEDLTEGLGLLFRAAKGAVEKIPTDSVEGFMSTTAGAVGRAIDAVGTAIDREISGTGAPGHGAPPAPPPEAKAKDEGEVKPAEDKPKGDAEKEPEPPRGPRIA
jgi:hypothetical protein